MFFRRSKSAPRQTPVPAEPSYVARDTTVDGNLESDGEIHIDGSVHGTVRAHTCLVDVRGEVRGQISAEIVYVRGRVIGPINGVHVKIQTGAHVEGDIINETISIENGAYVLGSIRHVTPVKQRPPENLSKLEAPRGLDFEDKSKNVHPFKAPKQS